MSRRLLLAPATSALLLVLACVAALPAASAQSLGTVDLRLRLGMSDADANVGDLVSFGFNVTNEGATTATGVTVTLVMPPGATFVSGHGCTTTDGRVATCTVENISPGGSIGYAFDVRFSEAGEKTLTGEVDADQVDTDLSDNADTLTVDVEGARPNPAPTGLVCMASSEGNRLTWGVNDFVIEYRVYRAVGAEGEAVLVWSGVDQTYLDTNVTEGTVYRYELAALREQGESERSVCTLTAVPEIPSLAVGIGVGLAALVGFVALSRRRSG